MFNYNFFFYVYLFSDLHFTIDRVNYLFWSCEQGQTYVEVVPPPPECFQEIMGLKRENKKSEKVKNRKNRRSEN